MIFIRIHREDCLILGNMLPDSNTNITTSTTWKIEWIMKGEFYYTLSTIITSTEAKRSNTSPPLIKSPFFAPAQNICNQRVSFKKITCVRCLTNSFNIVYIQFRLYHLRVHQVVLTRWRPPFAQQTKKVKATLLHYTESEDPCLDSNISVTCFYELYEYHKDYNNIRVVFEDPHKLHLRFTSVCLTP